MDNSNDPLPIAKPISNLHAAIRALLEVATKHSGNAENSLAVLIQIRDLMGVSGRLNAPTAKQPGGSNQGDDKKSGAMENFLKGFLSKMPGGRHVVNLFDKMKQATGGMRKSRTKSPRKQRYKPTTRTPSARPQDGIQSLRRGDNDRNFRSKPSKAERYRLRPMPKNARPTDGIKSLRRGGGSPGPGIGNGYQTKTFTKGVGAASGEAGAGAAGAAGAVAGVAAAGVGIAIALHEAAKAMRDYAYQAESQARKLAEFSPHQAASMAVLDANRQMRSIQQGSNTSTTADALTQAIDRFEESTKPFDQLATNLQNIFGAVFMQGLTTLLEPLVPIAEAANKYLGVGASTEPMEFGKWLADNVGKEGQARPRDGKIAAMARRG